MKLLILTTLLFSHGAFADDNVVGERLLQGMNSEQRKEVSQKFGKCMANETENGLRIVAAVPDGNGGYKPNPSSDVTRTDREKASEACHEKVEVGLSKEGYSGKLLRTLNAGNMNISEEVQDLAFAFSDGYNSEIEDLPDLDAQCKNHWYQSEGTGTDRQHDICMRTASQAVTDGGRATETFSDTEYDACIARRTAGGGGDNRILTDSVVKHRLDDRGRGSNSENYMYVTINDCREVLGAGFLRGSISLKYPKLCMDFAHAYAGDILSKAIGYSGSECANNQGKKEQCGIVGNEFKAYMDQISSVANKKLQQMIAACVGLRKLTKYTDEQVESGETSYASIDAERSGIMCTRAAPYTLDYVPCRTAVYWYNGTFLANDLVAPVVTNAYGQLKASDIQSEAYAQQNQGGVEGQTAAYEAQKKQFKLRAKQEQIKGATESAKAMAMFGNMMNFPSPKMVSDNWCSASQDNEAHLEQNYSCAVLFAAYKNDTIRRDLFANTAIKGKLLAVGAQSLAKAVVAAIVANSYKKQANMVDGVIQDFEQADFNQPENQLDFGSEFCKQNPDSPSCGGSAGRTPTTTGIDFNFGGNGPTGGGEIEFGEDGDITDSGSNEALSPTGTTGGTDELGSILGSGGGDKGGSSFTAPGAAKIGAANSTGGSGSGGGGAAAGGGGGGGGPGKKGGKAQGAFGAKIKPTYAKGGNFKGGGTVRAKSKSKNLFDNLTKNRSRNLASQSGKNLGAKNSRLFQTISKRYNAVQKEGGRLMVLKDK